MGSFMKVSTSEFFMCQLHEKLMIFHFIQKPVAKDDTITNLQRWLIAMPFHCKFLVQCFWGSHRHVLRPLQLIWIRSGLDLEHLESGKLSNWHFICLASTKSKLFVTYAQDGTIPVMIIIPPPASRLTGDIMLPIPRTN